MYVTLIVWVLFTITAIIGLKITWTILCLVAVFMNAANVIGYTRCDKVEKKA
jgi:hypothetical protein